MSTISGKGFEIIMALFFFIVPTLLAGQSVSKISCLVPHEISMSTTDQRFQEKEIYYDDHDDFPFWYRINIKDNMKLSFKVESLDDNANFDLYLYQYDGTQFCKMFINDNLELITFNKGVDLKCEKDASYYLGVYPVFPGGCGHRILLDGEEAGVHLNVVNKGSSCGKSVEKKEEEVLDEDAAYVTGIVLDSSNGLAINANIELYDPFTRHRVEIFSEGDDGFKIVLKNDGEYKVKINAFGYKEEITALASYSNERYTFYLKTSSKMNYTLSNVYFYPNTYAMKDESYEELKSILSFMKNNPDTRMLIVGHTNGDKNIKASRFVKENGEEWNFNGSAEELSLKRAQKIKDYLSGKGINSIRMKVEGKGGSEMIIENPASLKEAMMNIRVEVKITRQD